MAVLSLSTILLNGHQVHPTLLPRFLFTGVSQGQDLRNRVPKHRTLDQLKENICREIRNIPQEIFPKVMTGMATRV